MKKLKQGVFIVFFAFRPFFHLAFPMMFSLSLLGAALGLVLMETASRVQEHSSLIFLSFTAAAIYLATIKYFYPRILAFTDTRCDHVIIHLGIKKGIE